MKNYLKPTCLPLRPRSEDQNLLQSDTVFRNTSEEIKFQWSQLRNILTTAELNVRKGQLLEAETNFRECLQSTCSDGLLQLFGHLEARIGLAEVAITQYRLIRNCSNEQYWLLLNGVVLLEKAEKTLALITCEKFPDQYESIESSLKKFKNRISYKTGFIKREISQQLCRSLPEKSPLDSKTLFTSFDDFYTIHFNRKYFTNTVPQQKSSQLLFEEQSLDNLFLNDLYCYFKKRVNSLSLIDKNIPVKTPRRASAILDLRRKQNTEQLASAKTDVGQSRTLQPELENMGIDELIKSRVAELKIRLGIASKPHPVSQGHVGQVKSIMDAHRDNMAIVSSQSTSDIIEYDTHSLMEEFKKNKDNSQVPVNKENTAIKLQSEPMKFEEDSNVVINANLIECDFRSERSDRILSHEATAPFHSFEVMSPITEVVNISYTRSPIIPIKLIQSPDQEEDLTKVFVHLIESLLQIGEDLFAKKKFSESFQIYEQTLYVYQLLDQDITQDDTIPFLLRRLGFVRFFFGNIYGGLSLLERAIVMYDEVAGREESISSKEKRDIQKAEVWFDIGEAYLSKCHGLDLVRKTVTLTVKNHLKRDAVQGDDSFMDNSTEQVGDEPLDDVYHVGALEAVSCYQRAEELLLKVEVTGEKWDNECQNLKVRILARQGDCQLITGDYDQAIFFYEQALTLFPHTRGVGLLTVNSHVLCMLGIAHMLLGNFPKACIVLDCAQLIVSRHSHEITQDVYGSHTDSRFFITGLLTICTSRSTEYYKTIYWASRCINYYHETFGDKLDDLKDSNDIWLLSEVYIHFSQSYTELQELKMADKILQTILNLKINLRQDTFQYTRILFLLGENCISRKENVAGITYFRRALDIQEELSEQSFGVKFHRLKLSRSLGKVLLSLGQVEEASKYINDSVDLQSSIEDEITGSIVSLQFEVAMSALNDQFNLDKALSCLEEGLNVYKEEHKTLEPDVAPLIFRLASVNHVRALLADSDAEISLIAEKYYLEGLQLEYDSAWELKYAQLLYDMSRLNECFDVSLKALEICESNEELICFECYEEVILPQPLDRELSVADNAELELPLKQYALYLMLLTARERNEMDLAEEIILAMWSFVETDKKEISPYAHGILGYGLLESGLFLDATNSFILCGELQNWQNSVTFDNIVFVLALAFWKFRVNLCKFFMSILVI